MKLWQSFTANRVLVLLLFILVLLNVIVAYDSSILLFKDADIYISKITKLIAITILLTFFFSQRNKMTTVFLSIFLLLFIGDALYVFSVNEITFKLSKVSYLLGYCLIVFVLIKQIQRVKFSGFVSVYLILVLLLNSYFLYVLYDVAKENFIDELNLAFYVCHGIILILMCFFAFVTYLSRETAQSITYLLMVFCFAFSDVLGYINELYIYYWIFELLQRILNLAALYLLYKYVFEYHTLSDKERRIQIRDYFIPTTAKLRAIKVNF